jgi:hypothetical protein
MAEKARFIPIGGDKRDKDEDDSAPGDDPVAHSDSGGRLFAKSINVISKFTLLLTACPMDGVSAERN